MKKQVTFAESDPVHRIHQDEALPRLCSELQESKTALTASTLSGFKLHRVSAAKRETQLRHGVTIHIPKTLTSAPFLKHTELTPAQREYLYTVAASYSPEHVRNLINQHYMNVLHRCIRTDCSPEREEPLVTSQTALETDEREQTPSDLPVRPKRESKSNAGAKNPGKSILPKISTRAARISNSSASKQTKVKKRTKTASSSVRGKSPRRLRMMKLLEEEDDELNDSLSECMSSLSIGEWEDDIFSDL